MNVYLILATHPGLAVLAVIVTSMVCAGNKI
jgi:hypothetical protein